MKTTPYFFKALLMVLLIASIQQVAFAQTEAKKTMPPEKAPASEMEVNEVRQVINDLFDAMRAGDGEKVASLFVEDTKLQRAGTDREGNPRLGNTPVSGFAEAVGRPHDKVWDEQIWDLEIKVDDRLASAWMNFAFFLGGEFSHCGVNSMQLFKGEEGWKIMYLADTNRRDSCDIPEYVKSVVN